MANLPEQAVWPEGIYQFEESDPVIGGPDGVDNLQAKQLGNRTAYLKKELEDLSNSSAGKLSKSANLSDLLNISEAIKNLGLEDLVLTGPATGKLEPTSTGGYWKAPGIINGQRKELIIQWYTAIAPTAGVFNFNFPIPFPNAFLADAAMPGGSGGTVVNGGNVTKTMRQLHCSTAMSVAVITIGW